MVGGADVVMAQRMQSSKPQAEGPVHVGSRLAPVKEHLRGEAQGARAAARRWDSYMTWKSACLHPMGIHILLLVVRGGAEFFSLMIAVVLLLLLLLKTRPGKFVYRVAYRLISCTVTVCG